MPTSQVLRREAFVLEAINHALAEGPGLPIEGLGKLGSKELLLACCARGRGG